MSRALPVLGSGGAGRAVAPAQRSAARSGASDLAGPRATRRIKAVLVGPIQQENLALQYLAASARRAGHEAEVIAYNDRAELDVAVERALSAAPDVIGVGLAFQNAIEDYVAFLRALRPRGFRGHLTCGGHVPTFCHHELLRDIPDLDTAVRHEGEQTFVEMLALLAAGEPVRDVAGLVWREGDAIVEGPVRQPVMDLDALPPAAKSAEPYMVGGTVVDFVITARGCIGECNYCSIAAFTSEMGVAFRLRKPDPVAEEIAAAYHERGARVVFVQDDLFVLPREKKTVERCAALRAGLDARGVGDVVFWVKGRPETISPGTCAALRDMGAIHMFLGVESASAARLGYLGRTHLPEHNRSAIEICRDHGITPSFNFMLFDPDCSIDDIDATLDLAEQHLDLPWNVCRTEVYSGTALRSRLAAEGRLEGDYRSYGYRMRDPRAEVMFRILRVCLHERGLACESLLNRLISLSFARQIHERFFPGPATDAFSEAAMRVGVEARRDTLQVLRDVLAFVREVDVRDAAAVRTYAVEQALAIQVRDLVLRKQTEDLWQRSHVRGLRLWAQRGVVPPGKARAGYGVAAGS
ncbi:radical SAM protein [Sorangium sp. So ce375]|uniref:B12-binding domain-containing radical SAM protein n=1 Tax=Sorangium sp. So ce375 TaxID=3133306 RepID=UPI003F5BF242